MCGTFVRGVLETFRLNHTVYAFFVFAGFVAGFLTLVLFGVEQIFAFCITEFEGVDTFLSSELFQFVGYCVNLRFVGGYAFLIFSLGVGFTVLYISLMVTMFVLRGTSYAVAVVSRFVSVLSGK